VRPGRVAGDLEGVWEDFGIASHESRVATSLANVSTDALEEADDQHNDADDDQKVDQEAGNLEDQEADDPDDHE
jgi:hypothetical protein